jgi:hypothetical protein
VQSGSYFLRRLVGIALSFQMTGQDLLPGDRQRRTDGLVGVHAISGKKTSGAEELGVVNPWLSRAEIHIGEIGDRNLAPQEFLL